MAKIVLAHGILGFGNLGEGVLSALEDLGLSFLDDDSLISYFNGVKRAYKQKNHDVLTPDVEPLGSLEERAKQLAGAIHDAWGHSNDDIYMIGHSMGGLDCRRVINQHDIGKRVRLLITICTPHYGTPFANALADPRHPLRAAIPEVILELLDRKSGAIADLVQRKELHDKTRLDIAKYICIGGKARKTFPPSWLFGLSNEILKMEGDNNDGLVTLMSAAGDVGLEGGIWPVDHGGAIGWPTDLSGALAPVLPPKAHLARYLALLQFIPKA